MRINSRIPAPAQANDLFAEVGRFPTFLSDNASTFGVTCWSLTTLLAHFGLALKEAKRSVLILSACVFGGRKTHLKLTNGAVTSHPSEMI
jgi:hypothetical protein